MKRIAYVILILSVMLVVGCQENPVYVSAPLPPTELKIDDQTHQSLRLNWVDNSVAETGFLILRSSGENWENVGYARKNKTRWTDNNLEEFTAYYYRVFSVNGNASSSDFTLDSAYTLLMPPEHFLASLSTDPLQVKLTWLAHSLRDSGFVIERKSSIGDRFKEIVMENPDIREHIDTQSLLPGLTYRYRIATINDTVRSNYIYTSVLTPPGPPLAPTGLDLLPLEDNSARLVWTDESYNETGFEIESRKDGLEEWVLLGKPDRNTVEFIDRTVPPLVTLEYRIRSHNRNGYSDYSDVLTTQLAYFQINDGDESSSDRNVILNSNALYAQFIAVSNDSLSLHESPEWLSYSRSLRWTLSSGYGHKIVYARFIDHNSVSSPVYVDHISPLVAEIHSFVIAENLDSIQSNFVDVVLDAVNADSMQIGQDKHLADAEWITFRREFQVNLNDSSSVLGKSPGSNSHEITELFSPSRDEENYRLYARVRNNFGVPSDIVDGDLTVNIFGSLSINDGAEYTYSREVVLFFDAPAAESFAVANDSMKLISDPEWFPMRPSVDWLLQTGHRRKTVFVRYKNRSQAISTIYSASIIPAGINPSVILDGGSEFTLDREISVSARGDGNIDSIQILSSTDFSQSVWRTYQPEVPYILTTGNGEKSVYCRLRNDFGMTSNVVNAFIYTLEMSPSMILDNGAEYSSDRNVRVNIAATGKINQMLISNFADFHDAEWEIFRSDFSFVLSSGPGEKPVYLKIQNDFEIISEIITASLLPLPINPSITINDGANLTALRDIDLLLDASGDIDSMQLSFEEEFTNEEWVQYSVQKKIRLPEGKETNNVYCRFINDFLVISTTVVDSIQPASLSPSIIINNGDEFTRLNRLNLTLLCDNAIEMNWSSSDTFDPNGWIPYQRALGIEIDDVDRNWQIQIIFRHEFFSTIPVTDQIIYDTIAEINQFSWSAEREGVLFQNDEIVFTLTMNQDQIGIETGGRAEVTIGNEIEGVELEETEPGNYSGSYEIPEGILIEEENVNVNFIDRAGNIADAVAEDTITIHAENHDWDFNRTDNSHNILILNAALSGEVLETGDDIGVFTEEGTCFGMVTITNDGFPEGLNAWGDDPSTEEVDGFVTGDKMVFRFWDASQNFEYETGILRLPRGGLNYQIDGITVLNLHGTVDGDGSPLDWLYQRTADNHSILVREAFIGEEALHADDIIGLFTPEGLCVGTVELEDDNFPVGITAWADDPATEEIDGFRNGEEIMFRIWGSDQNIGMAAEAFEIEEGEGVYAIDGISILRLRTIE